MSPAFIIGIAVVLLIAAIALKQRRGPRVTHIETRRERKDDLEGRHD